MSNVLILDANQRSALAATRSLGKQGCVIYVVDTTPQSLAGKSKYCRKHIQSPDIITQPNTFINTLINIISKYDITTILPMTDVSTATLLQNIELLGDINIPAPSLDIYNSATNKSSLFELASNIGVPTPKTVFIEDAQEVDKIIDKLSYPIVIKPSHSRILVDNNWISTSVSYANSKYDLKMQLANKSWLQHHPFMLQEYIEGQGQGVFALYDKGKPVTFFAHKRLREKPPSGGVSVLSESIPVNNKMREISESLLGTIGWHGAAMVEFKVHASGTPYLMEINGRFWGSLQLAVDAGIDFPYLAYLLANGKNLPHNTHYKYHTRSRWLLGDLDRLYLILKSDNNFTQKLSEIIEFSKFFQQNTRYEINRLNDIGPFIFELKNYIKELLKKR